MDIIVLFVLLLVVLVIFKNFDCVIYYICIADILLRVLHFFAINIGISEIKNFFVKYLPSSVQGMIYTYTSGIIETVLLWVLFAIYAIFLGYSIRSLVRRS